MRVVSVPTGRTIWLFETVELNPRGLDLHPIYTAVRNRYSFSTPRSREEIEAPKDGIKFLNGSFKGNGTETFGVSLTIYNDGLVAETSESTSLAEEFLVDVTNFIKKQHGLYFEHSMIGRRRHFSRLLIESDVGLSKLSESLSVISARLNVETGRNFEVSGLTMAFDSTQPNDGMGPFSIERRIGVPLSSNRFYSSAPVTTEAHISILEQFEKLMK